MKIESENIYFYVNTCFIIICICMYANTHARFYTEKTCLFNEF